MREIRKIEKTVLIYERIIQLDVDNARSNCEKYLENIETIEGLVNLYSKTMKEIFLMLCNANIEATEKNNEDNLFYIWRKEISLLILNNKLNKVCYKITRLNKAEKKLKKVKQRLIQFKYL